MARSPVVIDLETKYTFRERKNPRELGISVFGIYEYATDKAWVAREEEVKKVFPVLEGASVIIGYNIVKFDLEVFQAYYPGDVKKFPTFDLMNDIKSKIGRRVALDEVVFATLGEKKIGYGLKAVQDYREGNWQELEEYCLKDVLLTKKLFDYGVRKGKIFLPTENGKQEVKVQWEEVFRGRESVDVSLTLPF